MYCGSTAISSSPRDGAWALGAWLTGQAGIEPGAIAGHLRAWGVKTFFLAFMLAGAPGGYGAFVRGIGWGALGDPVALGNLLIGFMFVDRHDLRDGRTIS